MPHVRRRMLITLPAPASIVRDELVGTLGLSPADADDPANDTFCGTPGASGSGLGYCARLTPAGSSSGGPELHRSGPGGGHQPDHPLLRVVRRAR